MSCFFIKKLTVFHGKSIFMLLAMSNFTEMFFCLIGIFVANAGNGFIMGYGK